MIISFYDNNIYEAVSTDPYGNAALRYIYLDRGKNLMVACNTRIIVTIPIEFDKQDKIPERIKHLYLSKEMFLYAKKNKCPIIFQEDGIYINGIMYPYLEIGAYVPYEQFLTTDNSEEYADVFENRIYVKDLLAIVKANVCSSDVVTIKWKIPKNKVQLGKTTAMYGIVYSDYPERNIGLIHSLSTMHNLLDINNNTEENNIQTEEDGMQTGEDHGQQE